MHVFSSVLGMNLRTESICVHWSQWGSWKAEPAKEMMISKRSDEDDFLPCGGQEKASNCSASFDRLESSVSLMHAHLSWQQQILSSLSGTLKKQPLKISNYLIHCCQGTETFLSIRWMCLLAYSYNLSAGAWKENSKSQQLLPISIDIKQWFRFGWLGLLTRFICSVIILNLFCLWWC